MSSSTTNTPWRYTRIGSIVLSYDFYLGIPVGVAAAAPAAFSSSTLDAMPVILLGIAGLGVAVATVVLTSLTLLLTTMSPEYRAYLQKLPGGASTLANPYRFVVVVAGAATLFGIAGATALPLVEGHLLVNGDDLGAALVSVPAMACVGWAVLGCVQMTNLLVYHWEKSNQAVEIEQRRDRALSRAAG